MFLMHFDDVWVERILDGDVLGLSAAEKALFRGVDRRAFHADGERAARAGSAVIEELPVAVAVAGVPRLLSFFRDDAFARAIVDGAPLVTTAADWLDNVPARIEGAIARARRRKHVPTAAVTVAPHVAVAAVPEGALDRWASARAGLGTRVVDAVAGGRRVTWPEQPAGQGAHGGQETHDGTGILVTGTLVTGILVTGAATDPSLAACARPLARLLARVNDGVDVDAFVAIACDEGCDDDAEAGALLADLVAEGLLVRR